MKIIARWLALLGAACAAVGVGAAWAAPAGFSVAAPPPWVERLEPDAQVAVPTAAVTDGVQYLLVDDQVRFDGRERVSYRHRAARATNERGVELIANVKLQFDPAFERLTIHAIAVRRGGSVVTRLDPAAIRLLQRETELDALMYDGSVTASAFLSDVRVGDIVDYEYSVRGENPVFGQRQFGSLSLQWGIPVARVHGRVVWPAGRTLQWKLHGGAPPPGESESGGFRERRWDLRDVPGRVVESDAPGSFDPYWAASWTEFDGWGAVSRWARPLYDSPAPLAPALVAEARRAAGAATDPEHRLLAVLRYVQSEVRYLGIEIGAGSHAPSRPEEVLRRRFGDCKDKTRLMIAMLATLGIEAQPALVNTQRREGVRDLLPTPGAFNHVLVHARLGGRDWWLDPTRTPQAADPDFVAQSDHGAALLVDGRSDALVEMAGEQALRIEREVRAVFDARGPREQPVPYTVTTVVRGAAAENLRATLAGKTREAMQKDYLNYYAAYYRGVSADGTFAVVDNPSANELTVIERYAIKDFWRRDDTRQRLLANIEVPDLADVLRAPQAKVRESPLWRPHPLDVRHRTEVLLAGTWSFASETRKVDGKAFALERSIRFDAAQGRLLLEDHFVSRRGQIAAADVPAHVSDLDRAREVLDYALQQPDGSVPAASADGPHWLVASVGSMAFIGLLAAAWRLYRWDPVPWPAALPAAGPPAPRGLWGWLLVVGLGLVVSVFRVGREMLEGVPAFGVSRWLALTQPGGALYHPGWAPLLLFELVVNLATLVLLLLLLLLYAQRRSSVPRLYIALLLWRGAVGLLDLVALQLLPVSAAMKAGQSLGALFAQLLFSGIWVAYFVRSRRVAATFVERRPGAGASPTPEPAAPAPDFPDTRPAGLDGPGQPSAAG